MTDFQICKNMNPITAYLTQTETSVMLSIVYIMINHSLEMQLYSYIEILHFKNFRGGGGAVMPQEAKRNYFLTACL